MNTQDHNNNPKLTRNWAEIEDAIVVEETILPSVPSNERAMAQVSYAKMAAKTTVVIGKAVAVFTVYTVVPFIFVGAVEIIKVSWKIFWIAMEVLFGFLYSVATDVNNRNNRNNNSATENESTGNWKRNAPSNNATGNGNNIIVNVNVNNR